MSRFCTYFLKDLTSTTLNYTIDIVGCPGYIYRKQPLLLHKLSSSRCPPTSLLNISKSCKM